MLVEKQYVSAMLFKSITQPIPLISNVFNEIKSGIYSIMTETHSSYNTPVPITVEEFRERPCSLSNTHPDYIPPTPEEVKALRKLLGFPQARLGEFLGKKYNE
jgi:hypothetical protein